MVMARAAPGIPLRNSARRLEMARGVRADRRIQQRIPKKVCLPKPAKSNGSRWITFRKQRSINNLPYRKNGSFGVKFMDFEIP
jgi:hypothetical protein